MIPKLTLLDTKSLICFYLIFCQGKKKVKKTYKVNHELNNKICLHQGDITRLEVDAIVNAGKPASLYQSHDWFSFPKFFFYHSMFKVRQLLSHF